MKSLQGEDYAVFGGGVLKEFSEEHRKVIWKHLRNSGLVASSIENPLEYMYKPASLFKDLLHQSPNAVVVFGCGDIINEDVLYSLGWPPQTHCATCNEDHSDAITLNIDPTHNPSLLVNVLDLNFWEEVPENSICSFKDETGLITFDSDDIWVQNLIRTLKPGGQLMQLNEYANPEAAQKFCEKFKLLLNQLSINKK
jgi:hypothetical protein